MRKFLLFTLLVVLGVVSSYAQVTTGSITGIVRDGSGETLIGATVKATHVPTGTVYGASSNAKGQFTIPNVRIGGPYTIVVSYVGFGSNTLRDLNVSLGNPLRVDVILSNASRELTEVTVTGKKNAIISSERNGTSTNISQNQLQQLPTVSRNIQDYVRLSPQAITYNSNTTGAPTGMSFAGMHQKYNKFSVDGASANDVFGLAATGTNGGQASANPIPLDAIQEMQVIIAPYDVTMVGFAGGGINAITKSGTNEFHGTAYTYLQNQDAIGKSVTTRLKYADFTKTIYGASLGGPIVKNKLFFFANFEYSKNKAPIAYNPAEAGSGSNFDVNTLESLRQFVLDKYKYDVGGYTNINKETPSTSVFARIDWNINDKNKLTIRHNYVDGSDLVLSRSQSSMYFGNSGYTFNSNTNSSVVELNSSLNNGASNVFRFTYNRIRDNRETDAFPSVWIQDKTSGTTLNYNFGAENSSPRNSLGQDNFNVTNNFTLYKGNHTITIGTNNDFYNTNNVFLQNYYGYYQYSSIEAFMSNSAKPTAYQVGYSTKGGNDDAASKIHAAQFRLYGQDAWQLNSKFKLTYGVGLELPVFFNKPDANSAFNSSTFATTYDVATNKVPKSSLYVTPRVGFNWDVNGDATTQVRGGAGLFTGPTPLVWLSNQYGNTGVASIRYSTVPDNLRFNYDPNDDHLGAYIPTDFKAAATEIDVTDRNFKFPTVFRTNLAVDQRLPWWGLIGTVEGLFTKTVNNVKYQNLNIAPSTSNVTLGNSTRPWYNFQRVDNSFSDIIYLTNTSKGYTYNITAQLQKPMTSNGWAGSIAYTYGDAKSLTDATSSTAMSNWRYAYNINGLNNLDLNRSNYSTGSRIVGYVSKTFKYLNNRMATSVGLIYNGQSGLPFSYLYTRNINGDDLGKTYAANLVYIPGSLAEAQFVNLSITSNGTTTTVSPEQQWEDFKAFAEANKYLKDNMGKNSKRNGDRMPWENHFDLRVLQDFYLVNQHKIQISVDIQNVGNLLNKDWGNSYYIANQGINLFTLADNSASTTPHFTFNKNSFAAIDGTPRPYAIADYTSRWRGQLSVRYSF